MLSDQKQDLQRYWAVFEKYGWTVNPVEEDTYELRKKFSGETFSQMVTCETPEELVGALAMASDNFDIDGHISWRYGQEDSEVLPTLYDSIDIKNRLDELHNVARRLERYPERDRLVTCSAKIWLQTGIYALAGSNEKGKIVSANGIQENEQVAGIRSRLVDSDHVYLADRKDDGTPTFARFNLECHARYVDLENGEVVGDEVELPDIYSLPSEVRRAIVENAFLYPGEECHMFYSDIFCNENEIENALTGSDRCNCAAQCEKKKHKSHGR